MVLALGLSSEYAAFHTVFVVPNIALESAMACRVFRGVKLGRITEEDGNIVKASPIRFNHVGPLAIFTTEPYKEGRGFKIDHHDHNDQRSPDDQDSGFCDRV